MALIGLLIGLPISLVALLVAFSSPSSSLSLPYSSPSSSPSPWNPPPYHHPDASPNHLPHYRPPPCSNSGILLNALLVPLPLEFLSHNPLFTLYSRSLLLTTALRGQPIKFFSSPLFVLLYLLSSYRIFALLLTAFLVVQPVLSLPHHHPLCSTYYSVYLSRFYCSIFPTLRPKLSYPFLCPFLSIQLTFYVQFK